MTITFTHGNRSIITISGSADTELVNDVTLIGQNLKYETEEFFSGNGSNKIFTLAESPISTKVKVGGTLKKAEVDYQVDTELKKITFTVAPASGSNNVEVDYQYEAPIFVRGRRNSSVNTYGRRDRRIVAPWIKTYADGVRYVQIFLNAFKDIRGRVNLVLPYMSVELTEGMFVRLVNPVKQIDAVYVVKSVNYEYPAGRTVAVCGEFDFDAFEAHKQIVEKIHDLEAAVVTVKGIRDYESAEEILIFTFVLAKQLGASRSPAETLALSPVGDGRFIDSGWDSGKWDYNAAWE